MTGWLATVVILSTVPGILLTGAVVHLYRRGRAPLAGLLTVAAVTVLASASGVLRLTPVPQWLPLVLVAATVPVGFGYAAAMTRRHLRRPAVRS